MYQLWVKSILKLVEDNYLAIHTYNQLNFNKIIKPVSNTFKRFALLLLIHFSCRATKSVL